MSGSVLGRSFFARDATVVAPELLGKVLVAGVCAGRIVEVEAYRSDDPASHTFRGPTARNAVMFGPAGHLYVYFTYGMHHCANVVTGELGDGQAVLLRALHPLDGIAVMRRRRGGKPDARLTDGPGKLCQALGIDRTVDGIDLCAGGGDVTIVDDGTPPPVEPRITARIGISVATDTPWRWLAPPPPNRV
ncbi:MAG: DNA-3-methyladenine glycosylase [Ilumatobacteraceae bacterium]